jgi:hypothetical protein
MGMVIDYINLGPSYPTQNPTGSDEALPKRRALARARCRRYSSVQLDNDAFDRDADELSDEEHDGFVSKVWVQQIYRRKVNQAGYKERDEYSDVFERRWARSRAEDVNGNEFSVTCNYLWEIELTHGGNSQLSKAIKHTLRKNWWYVSPHNLMNDRKHK